MADPRRWQGITVDVLITVYGEELSKIRATASAAMAIKGKHRTWILDDGRSEEVQALAEELDCHYVRRLSSNGAKAGTINHALSIAKGDFFASLMPTSCPSRTSWLRPCRSSSTATSLVQTPQTCNGDQHEHPAARRQYAGRLLQIHPTGPEPLQRRFLRRHERDLPRPRSTTSAASTPRL